MGKHDHPSLQFAVERGHLVPATPYEAEVLDSYSQGATLTVTLHQKRSLPLLKKYWAVLRDVVANCKTPWSAPDEASDALKLALGVTDISKTVSGKWFIRPGSISFGAMDEAEFRSFYDKAMAVLAEVTGIDPEELSKRYSHIPESESEPGPTATPTTGSEGGEDAPAADPPPSDQDASPPASGEGGGDLTEADARRMGAEARNAGKSRKAVPKEVQADERLQMAYFDGFDTGEAEDTEPGAEG